MKAITSILLLIPTILNGTYRIKPIPNPYDIVTVTTYTNSSKETDSTPNITASGRKLDSLNPAKHRIIAISRDLKPKYNFGSKVKIIGAGSYDGIYFVEDLMNKRWINKIDILINSNSRGFKLYSVKLIKI